MFTETLQYFGDVFVLIKTFSIIFQVSIDRFLYLFFRYLILFTCQQIEQKKLGGGEWVVTVFV